MTDITKMLLDKYSAKTAERTGSAVDDDAQLWSYRKAAALLHCFVPGQLQPLQAEFKHNSPFTLLRDDIVNYSGGYAEGYYTMKPGLRNTTLKHFSSREEMSIGLDANPARVMTALQQMWEAYLQHGKLPEAEQLPYRDLINLHQIVTWLEGIATGLPATQTLLELIKRKSVLANFEHLVISNFTGRVEELELFRDHINGSENTPPILCVYGPGGIGKSALMGKVLYERATAPEETRLPYVYLAFDQPSMDIEKPASILLEAVSQLELQYPGMRNSIDNFRTDIKGLGTYKDSYGSRSFTLDSRQVRGKTRSDLNDEMYYKFRDLLREISVFASTHDNPGKNVLIAFDTFEEVQYRDYEILFDFFYMLFRITSQSPVRVMVAGRASMKSTVETVPELIKLVREESLHELKIEDRIQLLERLGVRESSVAAFVAERVGGNPLSIRLAAQVVIINQDETPLGEVMPENWLSFKLDEQLIQGQLYKRILNHIHNEDVRKLAHPGMILRKVTAALIEEVLAPVCEIEMDYSGDYASILFWELEKEHALVLLGEFDTLKYRPDLRAVMVKLLQQDKYEEVRLLHEKAIAYYEVLEGVENRAEELYHRLALDNDETDFLNTRWMPGVEQSLAASLGEYSDRMKAWLASKMSLEVPRDVFLNASVIEWEHNVTRKVKRALLNMNIDVALGLLHERVERSTASPLFALEAKACLLTEDYVNAEAIIDQGINRVSQSTNRGRLAELLWLKSQVILLVSRAYVKADEYLAQAQTTMQYAKDPLTFIHIVCQRLLLQRTANIFTREQEQVLLNELNTACLKLNRNQKGIPAFLISLAVGFLHGNYPNSERRMEEYFPVYEKINVFSPETEWNMLTSENLRGLEKYREEWEDDQDETNMRFEAEFNSFV